LEFLDPGLKPGATDCDPELPGVLTHIAHFFQVFKKHLLITPVFINNFTG